ncbi:MAG: fibro-slime domain-containing protein [Polyangiaceae bacterium]|nr:fibro-slime domain-containing protein [Polyangiaceae bacterium]
MIHRQLTPSLSLFFAGIAGISALTFACGTNPLGSDSNIGNPSLDGNTPNDNGGLNNIGDTSITGPDSDPNRSLPAPEGCGNGVLDEDEVCDHGIADLSAVTERGCFANCLGIDDGYLCPTAGEPCKQFAICGDGKQTWPEQCDDGPERANGDGCNSNCKLEIGWKCEGSPSSCSQTTCGDGVVEGAEMCEPSLTEGCTAECQFAPQCNGRGACSSACGDGLVLGQNEQCDDGNNLSGDGCSETCQVEPGYMCPATQGECQKDANGNCIQRVPAVFRDFDYSHSDFGGQAGDPCDTKGLVTGGVENLLSNGKPVTTNQIPCTTKMNEWYSDTPASTRHNGTVVLYQNDEGNYVNRWGENGEQFRHPDNYFVIGQGTWCGNAGTGCDTSLCPEVSGEACYDPCPAPGSSNATCTGTERDFDGNPFFFPVDGIPNKKDNGGETAAVSDTKGGAGGYPDDTIYGGDGAGETEMSLTGAGPLHNFSFSTEIAYWFAFEEDTRASFEFVGDDDVWVFVNGELAVDLGGKHAALDGSFSLDGSSPSYGMEPGNVYEIKIFHAERQAIGSTFKLTLSGFNTSRSDCVAECGDGIIGFGEECDDGDNNVAPDSGGYSACTTECRLEGGFSGDGVVSGNEDCDEADPDKPAACQSCRVLVVR